MRQKKSKIKAAISPKDRAVFESLGQAIHMQRKALDISQEELAHRAGLHPAYVGGVERGERNIALKNIARLGKALGMELADLFKSAGL